MNGNKGFKRGFDQIRKIIVLTSNPTFNIKTNRRGRYYSTGKYFSYWNNCGSYLKKSY